MHLWYASNATTFQQLGWTTSDDQWVHQQEWSHLNGHAGVGCYSWGEGSVTYVMFVDQKNTVNFYWKDADTNATSNSSHPINQWTNCKQVTCTTKYHSHLTNLKASISIPNVHPSTSLGYTNYFYAQMADTNEFNGYNISWNAENTSFVEDDMFTVGGDAGLPGSHLSVTAVPNQSGGDSLYVFYQTEGSDVTQYTRDIKGGQWSNVDIQIPDA